MKKLFVAGLAFVSLTAFANPYPYKITRVIDGDTVAFQADFLPAPLKPELSIRVLGVDTPEKGHRADAQRKLLRLRRHHSSQKMSLNSAIKAKQPVLIEIQKHDKYGGRVLGDVIINGQKLSAMLIANGHARPYFGKKKSSWCN
jgi:micrococcal nuclease